MEVEVEVRIDRAVVKLLLALILAADEVFPLLRQVHSLSQTGHISSSSSSPRDVAATPPRLTMLELFEIWA